MKLQTLNYIHELLIATEKKARDAKRAAWNQANDALNDFENQDGR